MISQGALECLTGSQATAAFSCENVCSLYSPVFHGVFHMLTMAIHSRFHLSFISPLAVSRGVERSDFCHRLHRIAWCATILTARWGAAVSRLIVITIDCI